ncbi:hypothetical protein [Streptomyces abyssomicinicus]|uniref:hypothetical protein n=1 Tax=Streptomyces abyssomicinicus TaxID=574929 RepID=UPI0012505409|nr:hypothetical protein [Streptomyces abyssomicinicus]
MSGRFLGLVLRQPRPAHHTDPAGTHQETADLIHHLACDATESADYLVGHLGKLQAALEIARHNDEMPASAITAMETTLTQGQMLLAQLRETTRAAVTRPQTAA